MWQPHFDWATGSLSTFVCSHRSFRSLTLQQSALLLPVHSLAPFVGSLTLFTHSLAGRLKFMKMCSRCKRVLPENSRLLLSLKTRQYTKETLQLRGKWWVFGSIFYLSKRRILCLPSFFSISFHHFFSLTFCIDYSRSKNWAAKNVNILHFIQKEK